MTHVETQAIETAEEEITEPLQRLNKTQTELLDSLFVITPEDNDAYCLNQESEEVQQANNFLFNS